MPYKDIERKREYQREWLRKKKLGMTTRRPKLNLSEEEKIQRVKDSRRRSRAKKTQRRKELTDSYAGSSCLICGFDGESKRLIRHRKDGFSHKKFNFMTKLEFENAMKSREYIRLCSLCHKWVHWVMKYLGMEWNDIESRLGR